jgi:hypothetical protein
VKTTEKQKPSCFVIMPISDSSEYAPGHFSRVYEFLIKPACEAAEFSPIRADEVKNTNHIVLDVLKRLLTADLVLCDLSSKNPNVLYELGIRQAFDKPVALIKDNKTDRIFDIQGLRTHDYDETLRIDSVVQDKSKISAMLKATYEESTRDVNSLVRLLGVSRAEIKEQSSLTPDTAILLNAMRDVAERISRIERRSRDDRVIRARTYAPPELKQMFKLPNGELVDLGWPVFDRHQNYLGQFHGLGSEGVILLDPNRKQFVVPPDSEDFMALNSVPT